MAVVRSMGELQQASGNTGQFWTGGAPGSLGFYDGRHRSYAGIWRYQPNMRVCVDFLARNVAQLGLALFRYVDEQNRERMRRHPAEQITRRPNPFTTAYRFKEALMGDLGVFHNAYWLKIRLSSPTADGQRLQLVRIPAHCVEPMGGLWPTNYRLHLGRAPIDVPPSEILHFRPFSASSILSGTPPAETLRRILAEDEAATTYREGLWRQGARHAGVITRPVDAPSWTDNAKKKFREQWETLYTEAASSGRTAILEEGMDWKSVTFTAEEAQFLEARKLTREECARAYHIPLPMVGILDHATFSNITEQHKNLYQDCLAPWCEMIQQDFVLQLLPDYPDLDPEEVYYAFNLQDKLNGTFEEQASVLSNLAGRPLITGQEGRARLHLDRIDGDPSMDEVALPLNMTTGGAAAAEPAAAEEPANAPPALPKGGIRTFDAEGWEIKAVQGVSRPLLARHAEKWAGVIRQHFKSQEAAVSELLDRGGSVAELLSLLGENRWTKSLSRDLYALNHATAVAFGRAIASAVDQDVQEDRLKGWLRSNAEIAARNINRSTLEQAQAAAQKASGQDGDTIADGVGHVFAIAAGARAAQLAREKASTAAHFGQFEVAKGAGFRSKTWVVNSPHPRASHAGLDGETIPLSERFPNGLMWPCDPAGKADEVAGCTCSIEFSTEEV